MASRSIVGLLATFDGLRKLGEDIDPVLARFGLDLDRVDPTARIDRALELRIYTAVAEVLRDPLAGLKAGTNFGIGSYGPFTMLVMTCANAYEAFQVGVRYQQLTYLFGTLRFEPGEGASALVLTPPALAGRAFRFRVDGEASGTLKLVHDLQATFGLDLNAERVVMPYPRPPEAAEYEALFRCPVAWDGRETRFIIRNEHLRLPFPTADATAHRFFRAECDRLMVELNVDEEDMATRVRAHLALHSDSMPGIAEVAAALGTSERSLRRRLQEEGRGFRELVDEVRFVKAKQLLREDLPVDAVAQALGYSESAAFIHAFRRWAGVTPAAWRRQPPPP